MSGDIIVSFLTHTYGTRLLKNRTSHKSHCLAHHSQIIVSLVISNQTAALSLPRATAQSCSESSMSGQVPQTASKQVRKTTKCLTLHCIPFGLSDCCAKQNPCKQAPFLGQLIELTYSIIPSLPCQSQTYSCQSLYGWAADT